MSLGTRLGYEAGVRGWGTRLGCSRCLVRGSGTETKQGRSVIMESLLQVIITLGAYSCLGHIIRAFLEPGDEVCAHQLCMQIF